jgi:flavin-dependent dehydrogenase
VAYILNRPLLNERLKERAQAAGADYMFSCHIKDMEITETKVKLFTSSASNGIIEVKTAVIATGYGSNLAGKLGLGGISSFTIGAQAEVELTGVRGVEIYLDQSHTAGSFAWLVPTCGGKGLAGLMADKQPKAKLQSLLSLLIKNNKIHSADISLSCAAIPLHSRQTTFTDRVLVTGEAAGHIKPVTGGGLYFGLLGADIAIAELHGALLDDDVSAKRLHIYQRRWKKLLDREMRIGMFLRKIWSALGNRQIECLFSLADNRRMADFIANSDDFSFDWHGRLLLKSLKPLVPYTLSR